MPKGQGRRVPSREREDAAAAVLDPIVGVILGRAALQRALRLGGGEGRLRGGQQWPVVGLELQQIVPALGSHLACHVRMAVQRVAGHHAAFQRHRLQRRQSGRYLNAIRAGTRRKRQAGFSIPYPNHQPRSGSWPSCEPSL
jgi:hypothetical protein